MSLDISATGYVAFRFAGDAFVGFNVAACCQVVFCAVRFSCNLDITAACQAAFYSCPIDIGGYYAPGAGQVDFQLVSFYFLFQKNIAAACHIEPGSLTSVLNRMEEKGLIERRMLDGNRRTFYIFMTDEGSRLKDLVEDNFASIEKKAFRNISSEEQAAFMETFSKIYENLMNKGDTTHE